MEHKGIIYRVVQTQTRPDGDGPLTCRHRSEPRSGNAFSKSDAVLQAIAAIDKLDDPEQIPKI